MTGTQAIETSVLTRLGNAEVLARLAAIPGEQLARCTITDLELGHSARNAREWDQIRDMLGAFHELQVTAEVVERAQAVQRALAGRALRGRKVPDLLIAAAAELNGANLLHYDSDFEIIAEVTGQAHEWVVPRGAID